MVFISIYRYEKDCGRRLDTILSHKLFLFQMLSKLTTARWTGEHPPKPLSAYNVYFRLESRRLQDRERCREKYLSVLGQTKKRDRKFNGFTKRKNATLVIGKKWKEYKEQTRSYYKHQGRENLEKYFDLLAVSNADERFFLQRERKLSIFRAFDFAVKTCCQKDAVHKEIVWLLE